MAICVSAAPLVRAHGFSIAGAAYALIRAPAAVSDCASAPPAAKDKAPMTTNAENARSDAFFESMKNDSCGLAADFVSRRNALLCPHSLTAERAPQRKTRVGRFFSPHRSGPATSTGEKTGGRAPN